jgi:hypothetical protein
MTSLNGPNRTTTTTQGITTTVTAPPGSKIGPITVTPLTYTYLNGTWNFVVVGNGSNSNASGTSGTITFGTEELKCTWCQGTERQYGFTGNFSGQPVEGTYIYIYPTGDPFFNLTYTYHHRAVGVDGFLNIDSKNRMNLTDITVSPEPGTGHIRIDTRQQAMFYYRTTATGLHLHYGDTITFRLFQPQPQVHYDSKETGLHL